MPRLSKITRRYLWNCSFRLLVFLHTGWAYLFHRRQLEFTAGTLSWPLVLLWTAVLCSMLSQLNARSRLTTGCMKQYAGHFEPVPDYSAVELSRAIRWQNRGAAKVAVLWAAVNLCIGLLYCKGFLATPELVLLCALFYLCDLICVLFFCPFQFFLMRNRCCVNCRIFAWGSWMMSAPLLCVPHWYSWSLSGMGLLVLFVWEIRFRCHPERFWHGSNRNLQCASCKEQLCHYKWPHKIQDTPH